MPHPPATSAPSAPPAAATSARTDAPVVLRPAGLPGVELLRAHYLRQNFPRHFHRRYAVGVIERGAMEFSFLGRTHLAASGEVNLTTPGEVHDGHAATEGGWAYRMFYLDPEVVQRAAADLAEGLPGSGTRPVRPPDFPAGVLQDPELAQVVRATHLLLENPGAPLLARQAQLLAMLALWIGRHADGARALPAPGREPRAVALAREYLDAHCAEDVRLADLARLANLSEFHFLRSFTAAVGLPPHAYQLGARVRLVRELLAGPMRLADIAAEAGFTDQAHMTHVLRRHTGLTPGRYRKFLQG